MPHYKIHSLPLFSMNMAKGYFTYLNVQDCSDMVTFPIYSWLIEGAKEPILVDAGCSIEELQEFDTSDKDKNTAKPIPKDLNLRHISTMEDALARFGVSLLDIKTIIITHLHVDHIMSARKFPNAKFIVQEEELRFDRNIHPFYRWQSTKRVNES